MGYGDREIAKRLRDLVCRIAISVAIAFAEKSDRLLPFKDADRQQKPSQTVPVKVACGRDDDPCSVALGSETL